MKPKLESRSLIYRLPVTHLAVCRNLLESGLCGCKESTEEEKYLSCEKQQLHIWSSVLYNNNCPETKSGDSLWSWFREEFTKLTSQQKEPILVCCVINNPQIHSDFSWLLEDQCLSAPDGTIKRSVTLTLMMINREHSFHLAHSQRWCVCACQAVMSSAQACTGLPISAHHQWLW